VNVWDNGYPSGGNYWSDYNGTDLRKGPGQNVTGSDGIGDTPYIINTNNQDYYPLMMPWSVVHDVAVTNLTTCKDGCTPIRTVGQNYMMHINVTVENQGNFAENLSVTVYANATVINQTQTTLSSATTAVLTIRWNATLPYDNYTISAYASPIQGETETANNNFTGGTVAVTIPGDINGDFQVKPKDLNTLLAAFGSRPYNPNCDLANDDHYIGPKDLNTLLSHFGQHYP